MYSTLVPAVRLTYMPTDALAGPPPEPWLLEQSVRSKLTYLTHHFLGSRTSRSSFACISRAVSVSDLDVTGRVCDWLRTIFFFFSPFSSGKLLLARSGGWRDGVVWWGYISGQVVFFFPVCGRKEG